MYKRRIGARDRSSSQAERIIIFKMVNINKKKHRNCWESIDFIILFFIEKLNLNYFFPAYKRQ